MLYKKEPCCTVSLNTCRFVLSRSERKEVRCGRHSSGRSEQVRILLFYKSSGYDEGVLLVFQKAAGKPPFNFIM